MNIVIRFEQRKRDVTKNEYRVVFFWEKSFVSETNDPAIFEQALGYRIGLSLVKPIDAAIFTTVNGVTYTGKEFMNSELVKNYLLSSRTKYPHIEDGETLPQYLQRNKDRLRIPFTKNYLILLTPDGNERHHVITIQFDHLEFLQGLVSIIWAFGFGTIAHIVSIYDRAGINYTFDR